MFTSILRYQKAANTIAMTALLAGLFAQGVLAAPTTGSWQLDQSNTFDCGISYAQVDITADATARAVFFKVTPKAPTSPQNNFGIQSFGFNFANVADNSLRDWQFDLPDGWNIRNGNSPYIGGNLSQFGRFDITINGKGNSRQAPLEFSITLSDDSFDVHNFATASKNGSDYFFAAHVAGFDSYQGQTSHWVAGNLSIIPPVIGMPVIIDVPDVPAVPAPGAVVLGMFGVGTVSWMQRRRFFC